MARAMPRSRFIVLGLLLAGIAGASANLDGLYDHKTSLGDGAGAVTVWWSVLKNRTELSIAVRAPTVGWVGVGFSHTGGMEGADIVMGWVDGAGVATVTDRFAPAKAVPVVDAQQDLTATGGEEAGGQTTIWFSRPLVTCDSEGDLAIALGTTRVVYAFGAADPPAGGQPAYHDGNRGWQSVVLVGALVAAPTLPAGTSTVDVTMPNITVPKTGKGYHGKGTNYMCMAASLPAAASHLVRVEAVVQAGNAKEVHHILLYQCNDLEPADLSYVGRCYSSNMPSNLRGCNAGRVIAGWAVGAGDMHYPSGVGLPVGGTSGARHLLMEVHYDVPDRAADFQDSSGLKFYLTSTPQQDAAVLNVGRIVAAQVMSIPPKRQAFAVDGYCPAQCTSDHFPAEGINIFAVQLHGHLATRRVILRHIRKGKELPPIGMDAHYDFNLQQYMSIDPPIKVMPGDTLMTTCVYNTMDRTSTTFAGLATTEEMCLAYVYVYPPPSIVTCVSADAGNLRSCRGDTIAICSERAMTDFGGRVDVLPMELTFKPLVEPVCGDVSTTTSWRDVTRYPVCDAHLLGAGSGGDMPSPDVSDHVGSQCMRSLCATERDTCVKDANCVAAVECVLLRCNGVLTGCTECEAQHVDALAGCNAKYCGPSSGCGHCAACGICYGTEACGASRTGKCAGCLHCEACEGCWTDVDARKAARSCLTAQCADEDAECGSSCRAMYDCTVSCMTASTLNTSVACIKACSGPDANGGVREVDAIKAFARAGACAGSNGCVRNVEARDFVAADVGVKASDVGAPMSAAAPRALSASVIVAAPLLALLVAAVAERAW